MYFIISLPSLTACLKLLSVTLSAIFLKIGLFTQVSILNILLLII